MQGPSVLSGIALIRDWEISSDQNNGHAGILQICLGPMSNPPPFLSVLYKCSPTESHSPHQPWLFCISSLVSSLSHGQQGEEFLVFEAQWQPLPPLSSPVLSTARYCPWVNLIISWPQRFWRGSWVASILQIFQRRGKVRHWLVFSVWMGRSWDLNPGVIKLWIALPLTSPHCLMFLSRIDHTWLWTCWRIKSHYSRRVLWVRGLPLYL